MAKKSPLVVGLLIAALTATGCSTIYKRFTIDDNPPTSLSVDAKQRLLLVTDNGGPDRKQHIVCTEPSPDVATSIAASGSLSAVVPGGAKGEASAKSIESLTQLGGRIPTIQLLRDGLFRACEAYMNGALNEKDYRRIVLGYDDFVVALLAIDGLTSCSTCKAPEELASTRTQPTENKEAEKNTIPERSPVECRQACISPHVSDAVKEIVAEYLKLQERLYERSSQSGSRPDATPK